MKKGFFMLQRIKGIGSTIEMYAGHDISEGRKNQK